MSGSIGTTGLPAPRAYTNVGGVLPSGIGIPLQFDALGNLKISGSISVSNPSIGLNGVNPAPLSSTEVGGINPSGALQPFRTNAAGSLITAPDLAVIGPVNLVQVAGVATPVGAGASNAGTQRVILSSDSPLAPGTATALNQTNGLQITQVSNFPTTTSASPFTGQMVSTGTAMPIAASQPLINGVIVQALSTNSSSVYIGSAGVSSSTGFELQPGQATSMAVSNLNSVYVISVTSGDGICYVGS